MRPRICAWLLVALMLLGEMARPVAAISRNKLLIASDLHFNPMADASLAAKLNQAPVAQWEAILETSLPRSFSPYGQDSNWWLLKSALDQMHKQMRDPAVFMVAGDLLAHGFPAKYAAATHDSDREHYRAFVLKTIQFLALELRKRWQTTPILLTPGNNDDDCGDYAIDPNEAFLNDTAETARDLAKGGHNFTRDWRALGSYSVTHPTVAGLRLVSLNTIFFSNKYQAQSFSHACSNVNPTAASDLFLWLQAQIADAKQANQRVWLMMHIPPGIDGYGSTHPPPGLGAYGPATCAANVVPLWVPSWAAKFDALLMTSQSTVLASFAGHLHTDDFRVISRNGVSHAFVLVDPPISPIYGQNPGFRVVDFKRDGTIADQSTFYLTNLPLAGSKQKARWQREYQFSKSWSPGKLDAAGLGEIYGAIASTQSARDQWLKFNSVSSSADPSPPNIVRGLYCAIAAMDPETYRTCACSPAP